MKLKCHYYCTFYETDFKTLSEFALQTKGRFISLEKKIIISSANTHNELLNAQVFIIPTDLIRLIQGVV